MNVCLWAKVRKDNTVALDDVPIIQSDKKTDWCDKDDVFDADNEADDVTIDPLIEHSTLWQPIAKTHFYFHWFYVNFFHTDVALISRMKHQYVKAASIDV